MPLPNIFAARTTDVARTSGSLRAQSWPVGIGRSVSLLRETGAFSVGVLLAGANRELLACPDVVKPQLVSRLYQGELVIGVVQFLPTERLASRAACPAAMSLQAGHHDVCCTCDDDDDDPIVGPADAHNSTRSTP
ncbi:hypothetical protein PG984_002697 [Apiospora sp. TS-2023a]